MDLLLLVMLLIARTNLTHAWNVPFYHDQTSTGILDNGIEETNLAQKIYSATLVSQVQLLNESLRALESMRSWPACARLAASELIDSCQSIGSDSSTTAESRKYDEESLESTKSLFAARLAICELRAAGAVPAPCLLLFRGNRAREPGHLSKPFGRHNLNDPTVGITNFQDLNPCLKALESKPQSWTSYSNAKQNAMKICAATRHAIEKDELLETHHSGVRIMADASIVLSESTEQQREMLRGIKGAYSDAIDAFKRDLAISLQENGEIVHSFVKQVQMQIKDIWAEIQSLLGGIKMRVDHLQDGVSNSNLQLELLQANIRKVFHDIISGTAELAQSLTQASETNQYAIETVEKYLELVGDQHMRRIQNELEALYLRVQTANKGLVRIHDLQEEITQKAQRSWDLSSQTILQQEVLGSLQVQFARNMTEIQLLQEEKAEVNLALLDQSRIKAANLLGNLAILDGKIDALSSMAVGILGRLCWYLLLFSFVISMITLPILSIAELISWKTSGTIVMLHFVSVAGVYIIYATFVIMQHVGPHITTRLDTLMWMWPWLVVSGGLVSLLIWHIQWRDTGPPLMRDLVQDGVDEGKQYPHPDISSLIYYPFPGEPDFIMARAHRPKCPCSLCV